MYYLKFKDEDDYIEATERSLDIQENVADLLTFTLFQNSPVINKIIRFKTEIEVWENYNKVFTGRVIDKIEKMDDIGLLSYQIICESPLNFLNDSRVGKWDIHPDKAPASEETDESDPNPSIVYENMNIHKTLELILNNHNSKVNNNRKIFIGNIQIKGNVFCYTNRETSLDIIQSRIVEKKGGILRIREHQGKYYLDYLLENSLGSNIVELGVNLKNIDRHNNLDSIVTRMIPLGQNDITIADVNDGKEYIEDSALVAEYGVIEQTYKWEDVTIKENLKAKAIERMKTVNNLTYSISLTALDLYLISQDFTKLNVGQMCTVNNALLNMKDTHRIISKKINMDEPHLSDIVLSNNPATGSSSSTSIRTEIDNTKIEIMITDKKLMSKVSNGTFESYQEQVAEGFKKTVKKGEEFESELLQSADKYQISMNGNLQGKTYTFTNDSFKLGGTDSGNTVEHTNNYSKWIHENGEYSMATAQGFKHFTASGSTNYQYITFNTRIAKIRNGYWHTVQLPSEFKGKRINQDFQLFVTTGDIDADAYVVGSRRGALRNIFAQWTDWNSSNATIKVRPCLQKIGIDTGSLFGWDNATTSIANGAVPNEGAIDIIVFAQM